ncbi:MAG: chemotaxis protein CheD [Rubripirellula sp.]
MSRGMGVSIRMGEMSVDRQGQPLRTLLGSCVGLALHDRRQQIGGLAHIVLPRSRGKVDRPGKFVDTAIPELIERMRKLAEEELRLTAKFAGGAKMFATSATEAIGDQNVESCKSFLRELKIPVLATHCGGEQGRRMTFDPVRGIVRIEIVGLEPIEI